jgi:histidinol-phosphatase (PHP family)
MYDYHTHSSFSNDGVDSVGLLVGAAIGAGLDEIAITDHYDPDYKDPNFAFELDFDAYIQALNVAAEKYNTENSPIRLVRGMEIGMQTGEPARLCAKAAANQGIDFIIGSVHCAHGCALDIPRYMEGRDIVSGARDYYSYALACLDEYDDFDVFGHLNVIDRYMDSYPDEEDIWDVAEMLLKKLVDMGKGIEVNTSAWRIWNNGHTTPTLRMLRRYRELGGETVTTGSDAHYAQYVGGFLKEGEELLRNAGFRYLATFKERQPFYVKL